MYCAIIKRTAAGFLAFFSVFMAACSYPAADQYQDILADTDALMRLNICFADARQGRAGPYTRAELHVLIRDLEEGYRVEDASAYEATRQLQQAAALLADSISEQEDTEAVRRRAEACYAAGIAAIHDIPGA